MQWLKIFVFIGLISGLYAAPPTVSAQEGFVDPLVAEYGAIEADFDYVVGDPITLAIRKGDMIVQTITFEAGLKLKQGKKSVEVKTAAYVKKADGTNDPTKVQVEGIDQDGKSVSVEISSDTDGKLLMTPKVP